MTTREDLTAIIYWLMDHPSHLEAIRVCIELEHDIAIDFVQHEAAERFLKSAYLGWCPECHGAIVVWPDNRESDWPELALHACPALKVRDEMEGVFTE